MARSLIESEITTAVARGKLDIGEHARRLDADAHILYRKRVRGGGVWLVRWRNRLGGAKHLQRQIGPANDVNDKDAPGLWTYRQAEAEARRIVADVRMEMKVKADGPVATVRSAVEKYCAKRDARDSKRKGRAGVRSDASQRLHRHVLGQDKRGNQPAVSAAPLADVALFALTSRELGGWLRGLPSSMMASTKQRLVNDLRAALNEAINLDHEVLPASVSAAVKHAFAASTDDGGGQEVARDSQILADSDVAKLLAAAREVDAEGNWDGDLFRIVVTLAATGARFSQIARMRVGDVQDSRVMIPTSRKGRGAKAALTPVPVGADVIEALQPATVGRPAKAPLFERWRHKQVLGATWERDARGPWREVAEIRRPWRAIAEKVGMSRTIPYALRHSSIVRGIRANLPIRLVAVLHDTSATMVERHYSKWIATGLDDLAAKAVIPLIPPEADKI